MDEVIKRVEVWLGSPKETKKHPTVMLHTDKTVRVIALDDLRELLDRIKDQSHGG
ncbi:MAG: hypothetical protein ACJ8FS_16475 [Sphingomicrobium sp.]